LSRVFHFFTGWLGQRATPSGLRSPDIESVQLERRFHSPCLLLTFKGGVVGPDVS
jgi:hypothetical protein